MEMFKEYQDWCNNSQIPPMGRNTFIAKMKMKGESIGFEHDEDAEGSLWRGIGIRGK